MTTTAPSKQLNSLERTTLRNAEQTIQRHLGGFVEVGTALAVIRDRELYRETHKTFGAYIKEKWDFQPNYAYKLIAASAVVENVSNCTQRPTNEGQARALSEVPTEQQKEVWEATVEKAEEQGTPITAKLVEEVAAELVEVIDPEEADEVVPITPPKSEPLKDAKGKKVPKEMVGSWEEAGQLDDWSKELSRILREVKEFAGAKEGAWLDLLTFGRDIANCKHALKFAKPYVVCPDCGGDGCQTCRNTGWLPQTSLTRNAPAEEKSA